MKMTHKLNSFIGSLVIAFAIILFLPSMANAGHGSKGSHNSYSKNSHGSKGSWNKGSSNSYSKNSHGSKGSWNKGSHGSKSSSNNNCKVQYNKYKAQAAKYLRAYYRCYNYTYYRYYVYFMKKAKACQNKPTTTNNCSKYKNLADRYLAAYNRCGYYAYYKYYVYYKNLYNKCQVNANPTGKVCGQVFEDSDRDNSYSTSDKPLANVSVKVTDSKGNSQTVKTNATGNYCASNVSTGSATVTIIESTLPDNATQVVGTPSTNVDIKANKSNWEERNGYSFPEPTGNVCGTVYEDKNEDNALTQGEIGEAGIKVTLMDANGDTRETTTNAQGNYCFKDVVEGSATVTLVVSTLPSAAEHTVGNVEDTIDVIANKDNTAGEDGYIFPVTLGNVCGQVIVDGKPQAGVKVVVTDVNGDKYTATTNAQGNWCAVQIPEGDVTVDIDESTLPANVERVTGTDLDVYTVVAGQNADAKIDGYVTKAPVATGTVCGTVFEDVNKNKRQTMGEPGIENITVTVTDINGDAHIGITDAQGNYCVKNIAVGEATVVVDTNDVDMPAGATDTTGKNPSTVNVLANTENNAGKDGYNNPNSNFGCVCTLIYHDSDSDGAYSFAKGDKGIANVAITLVDSKGQTHNVETDEYGYMFIVLPIGTVTLTVDTKDTDLPQGASLLEGNGKTSITFENTRGQTNPGHYGYID
jgi:phosphatidate phosphatase APP1